MLNKPIGVFDSGIGGLTVLKELERVLPNEDFIYLGDTKNFPYGEKSKEQIIEFSRKNISYLINLRSKNGDNCMWHSNKPKFRYSKRRV